MLCETGGLACIIGQAGTGKSASAGAYIRAFELAGRRVIGTSTSQAATDNLKKEAGIEGYNCAELLHALDSGKLTLGLDDVIVLDEAGMVGAKTFRRIQEHVDKAGGKLVAVGDPKQLEAIEAGGPFAELCEKFGAAEITQIQRQRNPGGRWRSRSTTTRRPARTSSTRCWPKGSCAKRSGRSKPWPRPTWPMNRASRTN